MIKFLISLLLTAFSFQLFSQDKSYLRPEIDGEVLDGVEAISKMHVAKGFKLELFAQEPHVINPVVMRFDERGRLWIVEMVGYMTDMKGSKELDKVGRISILEDTNNDGKMDNWKVFLDGLQEPRAMAFHKNGILWADYKSLYFTTKDENDKAGETVVVDADYASGHSVEHRPNGLLRTIDNWYYNAKSSYRYKEVNGKWLIEKSEYRGQWGLSADNVGRLYHGQQNTLLRAEIFTPNFFLRNPSLNLRVNQLATKFNEIHKNCYNIKTCEEAVFAVRTSRDMRDGYLESKDSDILPNGYAKRCTSASSHFFYRDNYFPADHNVFVVDPALHLVKTITITRKDGIPTGKNTYEKEEIVASPDTRFRPVDVQSAPDGTLYIADMYHGVLQHRFFMNAHLSKFIKKNDLFKPEKGMGRVYRLSRTDKKPRSWKPFINADLNYLVEALGSENPWMRDSAQRILVDNPPNGAKEALEKFYDKTDSVLGKIHALWTLEGIRQLSEDYIIKALASKDAHLKIHAARASWSLPNSANLREALVKAIPSGFEESVYYLTQRLANFKDAHSKLSEVYLKWSAKPFFAHTVLSGSGENVENWLSSLAGSKEKKLIQDLYNRSKRVNRAVAPKLQKEYMASFDRGKKIYLQNCFSCHGKEGRGLLDMGPPLVKSDWVTGGPEIIAKIILKGMTGEIEVSGKKYKPKIPMLAFEGIMNDKQIADVITFIRNNWGNKSAPVSEDFVKQVRQKVKSVKQFYQQSDFRK